MVGDAGEHVGDIVLRVETVELGGLDQGIDYRGAAAAGIGAGKQIIFTANGNRPVILPMSGRRSRSIIPGTHSMDAAFDTKAWLAAQPEGRFQFVFTPKHGSWLNLVEGFFAKAARSVFRHIRVGSKHELKQRIIEFIDDLNRDPVIHRWQYQIDATAHKCRNSETLY